MSMTLGRRSRAYVGPHSLESALQAYRAVAYLLADSALAGVLVGRQHNSNYERPTNVLYILVYLLTAVSLSRHDCRYTITVPYL